MRDEWHPRAAVVKRDQTSRAPHPPQPWSPWLHRLQEEPPLHLSVATHNFVERGDSEVEVVVAEVWARCGRR